MASRTNPSSFRQSRLQRPGTRSRARRVSFENLEQRAMLTGSDDFAFAAAIPGGVTTYSDVTDNTTFTREGTEPASAIGGTNSQKSIWWKFQVATSGPVTLNTYQTDYPAHAGYGDTTLEVFSGPTLGTLEGSNDDIGVNPSYPYALTPNPAGAGYNPNSLVTFNANAGTIYYVRVDGYNTTAGSDDYGVTKFNYSGPTTVDLRPSVVYVDDSYTGVVNGQTIADADAGLVGAQPASFNVTAFTTITAALAAVSSSGTIVVNGGAYGETISLGSARTLKVTGVNAPQSVTINSVAGGIGSSIVLDGNSTLAVGDGASVSLSSAISGTGNLTKAGTGVLTLDGANTYSGTTTVSAGTLKAGNVPIDNLLAYYNFNNAATLGADGSGNANNGTLNGGAIASGAGFEGGALSLPAGANGYLQMPNLAAAFGGQAATISIWTKLNVATPTNTALTGFVNLGSGSNDHYPWVDGTSYQNAFRNNSRVDLIGLQPGIDRTQWHLVTIVSDPTDAVTGWRMYQNGTLIKSVAPNFAISGFQIGAQNGYYLNGFVDDVRLYNRALSTAEVQAIAASASVNAIPDNSAVVVAAGATLELGMNETIGSLSGATGSAVKLGTSTLSVGANNASTNFSGVISGAGGVTKIGTGVLAVDGASTYTGATNVSAGTLRVGALHQAYQVTTNITGNQAYGGSLGYDFTVNAGKSVTIKELGFYDSGLDGLANAHNVYISASNGATVFASAVVPGGTTAPLINGYRFVKLATPIVLAPGNYTVWGDNYGTDLDYNAGTQAGPTDAGANGELSFFGPSHYGTANTFPTNNDGGPAYRYGAVSFNFENSVGQVLPASTVVTLASGAALDLHNNSQTIGTLAGAAGSAVTLGSGILTVGGTNANSTFAGNVSGSGGLTKVGTGTLTLDGNVSTSPYAPAGTFTLRTDAGQLTVNGNVQTGGENLIVTGAGATVINGQMQSGYVYPQAVISTAGLQAYYRLNESGGTVANDASGNGNNGAITGAVTLNQSSATPTLGTAASFTGGVVNFPTTTALGMNNGSWTAMTWINVANAATDQSIFGTDTGATRQGLHLNIRGSKLYMGFYADDMGGNQTLASGTWYHAAWTYDAVTKQRTIYLNGAVDATGTAVGNFIGSTTLHLGSSCCNGVFGGLMDDAAVFNRALSAAEIAQLYSGKNPLGGGLTKSGTGTLTLAGDNSAFVGPMSITAGLLVAANNNALGTTTAGTTISAGGTLGFSGNVNVAAEPVSVVPNPVDAIVNVGGTNSFAGTITATPDVVNANFGIRSDAGQLTLTANLIVNGENLAVSGAGATIINGQIQGGSFAYPQVTTSTTGLQAYYRLNETSGTVAADASGKGNTGAVVGSVTFNQPSAVPALGTAASFTGGNVDFPTATALGMTNGSWTTMAWINVANVGNTQSIFGTDTGATDQGLHLNIRNSKLFMGFYGDDMGGNQTLASGTWYHVAWTYDAVTKQRAIYLNGAVDATGTAGGNFIGATTLHLGKSCCDGNFSGSMDDASVFNRALSAAEISQLYASRNPAVGGGLTKSGPGTLTLGGDNSAFVAPINVNGGTLIVANNNALGDTAAATTVASGAVLDLNGRSIAGEVLNISGTGLGAGALTNSSASPASWSGLVNNGTYSVGGTGDITLGGQVSTSSTLLTKVSNNKLTLSGTADNGGMTAIVNAGTLILAKTSNGGVHAIGGGGTSLTINNGGTVQLAGTGSDQIYVAADVLINAGGTLDLNGNSEGFDGLSGAGSIINSTGAPVTLTVGQSDGGGTFSGTISGNLALTKTGGGALTLSGTSSNTYSGATTLDKGDLLLDKTGGAFAVSGPMQMGGGNSNQPNLRMLATNQFAAGVVMSLTNGQNPHARFDLQGFDQTLAGIVSPTPYLVVQNEKLGGGGTSQAATLTLNGAGNYSFAGYLRDEDDGGNAFKLNVAKTGSGTQSLVGGAIYYTGTTAVTGGVLNLIDTPAFNSSSILDNTSVVFDGSSTLNYAGPITGSGSVTKSGTGSLTFSGTSSNTYFGATIVSNGDLYLGKTGGATAVSGPVQMGGGNANQPNLRMLAANQFGSGVVMSGNAAQTLHARFDLQGFNQTLAGIESPNSFFVVQNERLGGGGTAQDATLTLDGAGTYLFNGGFVRDEDDGGHTFKLNVKKTGLGTQTLAGGSINYTGSTIVDAGILELRNNGAAGAFLSNVTLNGTSTLWLTATSGQTSDFRGNVSGTGSLVKKDTGTVRIGTFSGTPLLSYSGDTTVEAGILNLQGQAPAGRGFDSTGTLIVNSGAEFQLTGLAAQSAAIAARFGALSGSGTVSGGFGSPFLELGKGDGGATFSGTLSNSGATLSVTKIGAGTQTLSGAGITYSGATAVSGGALKLTNTSGWNSNVTNNATVDLNSTLGNYNLGIGKTFGGSGTFLKTGTGQISLWNSVITASGSIQVQQGTLRNDGNSVNWSGSTANVDVSAGATLDIRADSVWINSLTGAGSIINSYGAGAGGTDTITIGVSGGDSLFTGVIGGTGTGDFGEGNGKTAINKVGAGTLTLTNANTYVGGTTVTGGTLLANNTTGSATGTAAVNVLANTTLGGTGIISGPVTIAGTLSPGAVGSAGQLTINNSLTFAAGSTLSVNLNGVTPGALYDQIVVSGPVTIDPTAQLVINRTYSALPGETFVLVKTTGANNPSGTFSGFAEGQPVVLGGQRYFVSYNDPLSRFGTGNDVALIRNRQVTASSDVFAPVLQNTSLTGNVKTNLSPNGADIDPDGDGTYSISSLQQPSHGTVSISPAGVFTYVPDADYLGSDQFSYTLSDAEFSSTATVDVATTNVIVAGGVISVGGLTGNDRIVISTTGVRFNNVQILKSLPGSRVVVFGGAGDDTITVSGTLNIAVEFHGEDGNDYLTGGNGADLLDGGAGQDRLLGGNGNDVLLGGGGSDTLSGGAGNDTLDGDGELDPSGNQQISFDEARDTLNGDAGDDLLYGRGGNDTINGGIGNDQLFGGTGNDTVSGDAGNDLLAGEEGADTLYGRAGRDVLVGGDGSDTNYGSTGADLIYGGGTSLDDMTLAAVWLDWASANVARVNDAWNGLAASVVDDHLFDVLHGEADADWYLTNVDDVFKLASEKKTPNVIRAV